MAVSLRSFCSLSRFFQNLPNKCPSPLTQVININAVLKGSTDLNVTSQSRRSMTKWHKFKFGSNKPLIKREPPEILDEEDNKQLVARVSEQMANPDMGRLFAVVYIRGLQRKVTAEDMLIVTGSFPPNIGDRLRLEKVLLVGGKDFSLVGRPILSRSIVRVEATVIEKTLSNTKVRLSYTARKHNRKFKLLKDLQTVIVINSIEVNPKGLISDTSDTISVV
ncbi:39S ribosomal protein L21, mitochondrial [Octopus sinensis]|uniref:Large ribosomal subunit protein bL21m n=1 Tax=Octopus sinensis TaxID=2607531 RepID=A0A6P7T5M7_9MOLL|nr:39S ribosomal protein L21, mitochondrial [Octopus sinensis]